MSNFIYPDSQTRKMYGAAGRRLAEAAKLHAGRIQMMENVNNAKIDKLRGAVIAFESLGWWRRLWLLIREAFGKRHHILPK